MLAVFVALTTEQRCIQRHVRALKRQKVGAFPVFIGEFGRKRVAICRTGIGGERARAAARTVLEYLSPQAVVSLGFAGGVTETVHSSEVVLCQRVYLYQEAGETARTYVESDGRLLALAREAAVAGTVHHHNGNSATVPMFLPEPDQKREVGRAYPVDIVEMESYYVGQQAAAKGIPFLCVRAVTDEVSETASTIGMLTREGTLQPWRAIPFLLRAPTRVSLLARLALSWRKATGHLSAFSGAFLTLWAKSPDD